MERFRSQRLASISKYLKIEKKIKFILHEDCHTHYSYYFFPQRRNGIAITSEGIEIILMDQSLLLKKINLN